VCNIAAQPDTFAHKPTISDSHGHWLTGPEGNKSVDFFVKGSQSIRHTPKKAFMMFFKSIACFSMEDFFDNMNDAVVTATAETKFMQYGSGYRLLQYRQKSLKTIAI
jgi:hypothetical protein